MPGIRRRIKSKMSARAGEGVLPIPSPVSGSQRTETVGKKAKKGSKGSSTSKVRHEGTRTQYVASKLVDGKRKHKSFKYTTVPAEQAKQAADAWAAA